MTPETRDFPSGDWRNIPGSTGPQYGTCPDCGRTIHRVSDGRFWRHKMTRPWEHRGHPATNPVCPMSGRLPDMDRESIYTYEPAPGPMWEWRWRDKRDWHDWEPVTEGTGRSFLAMPAWEIEFRPRPIRRFLAYNAAGATRTVEAYDQDAVPARVHSLGDLKGIVEL